MCTLERGFELSAKPSVDTVDLTVKSVMVVT